MMRVLHSMFFEQRNLLALILGLAFAARVASAAIVPPWQGPDEPKHFEAVRVLVDKRDQLWQERRLPNLDDAMPEFERDVIASMARNHFWEYWGQKTPAALPKSFYEFWENKSSVLHRPSLYYFLGALALIPFQGSGLEFQLLIVRLLSAILSTLAVLTTYFVGKELFPKDRFLPLVSAAFVAALPMHIFLGGTVNSDNLVTLWGSLTALGLTWGFRRGFTIWRLLFVLSTATLAILTKRTAVGLLPAALIAVPAWLISLPRRILLFTGTGLALLGGFIAVAIVSGWASGMVRFDRLRAMVIAYSLNEPDQFDRFLQVANPSAKMQEMVVNHVTWLFRSFWGVFGWFSLHFTPGLVNVITWASLIAGVGFLGWLAFQIGAQIRRPNALRGSQILVVVSFVLAIASMVVLAVGERLPYFDPGEVPQGRYLFGVVAPIATVYALGARAFVPRHWRQGLAPALLLISALFALDVVVLVTVILPSYAWQIFP